MIGAISDLFQAQQLHLQCGIQEQVQSTKVRFAALAKQMQQLISTTTAAALARNNPPTPRPSPVTSLFHSKEPTSIFQMKLSIKLNWLWSLVAPQRTSNQRHHQQTPCTITNFPVMHAAKMKSPARRPKDTHCPQSTHLNSRTTHQRIIMITRNLSSS
uniref:Uncharacterized protein n=1 Tax=Romanomermis culicivorax TaxID=13658 RepID=A0A915IDK1_ROMCU